MGPETTRKGGSVGLAVMFHATGNSVFPFIAFPDRTKEAALFVEELSVVPLWIVAGLVLAVYGARTLRRGSFHPETVVE